MRGGRGISDLLGPHGSDHHGRQPSAGKEPGRGGVGLHMKAGIALDIAEARGVS